MIEQWKEAPNFELYEVSNLGNVRRKYKNINKKPSLNFKGYPFVCLYKGNKPYTETVHRLVAKAFIDNPENKPQVNHIDGDKTNNKVENLEWVTNSENLKHAALHGLHDKQLNEREVKEIYDLAIHKVYTHQKIADIYGVCRQMVTSIKNKKRRSHLL